MFRPNPLPGDGPLQRLLRVLRQLGARSLGSISLLLVGVCTTFFVAVTLLDLFQLVSWEESESLLGFSFRGVLYHFRLYEFLTAPLLHGSLVALLFNMLTLWMCGPLVEAALGRGRYVTLSVFCAEVPLLLFLLLGAGTGGVVLGYSAVIFGILVALAYFYPDRLIYFFGFFPLKIKYAVLLMAAIVLYLTVEGGGLVCAVQLFGAATALGYLLGLRWWDRSQPAAFRGWELRQLPGRFRDVVLLPAVGWARETVREPLRRALAPRVQCPRAACGHCGAAEPDGTASPSRCGRCQQPLPLPPARGPVKIFAVLGPGRCGKTSWLVRCIDSLRTIEGCRFLLEGQEAQWQAQLQGMNLARGTPPTPEVPGTAWCLGLGKNGRERGVYLHDLAGGECPDADRLARYVGLRRLDGVVIVVDPFGLPAVRQRHGALVQQLRPPVEPAATFFAGPNLAALIEALERLQARRCGRRWDPAAVVVTKLDVLGLYREFGDEQTATTAAVDAACRARLVEWGFGETMQGLESSFRQVRYFASLARGSGGFSPANALRWLLNP